MKVTHNRVHAWSSMLVWCISACLGIMSQQLYAQNIDRLTTVKIDQRGNKVAIWEEVQEGMSVIKASNAPALSNTWSTPKQLSTANVDSREPKLAMNDSGQVVAAWLSQDTTNQVRTLYVATIQLQINTPTWSSAVALSSKTETVSSYFNVDISDSQCFGDDNSDDNSTEAVAAWSSYVHSLDEYRLCAAHSTNIAGNTWSTAALVDGPTLPKLRDNKKSAPVPKADPKKTDPKKTDPKKNDPNAGKKDLKKDDPKAAKIDPKKDPKKDPKQNDPAIGKMDQKQHGRVVGRRAPKAEPIE